MKLKHIIFAALISSFLLSGCGNSDSLETPTTEPTTEDTTKTVLSQNDIKTEPFDVEIEAKIIENNGMPSFIINTNLPDETELMLTLTNNDYIGQTHITIKDGTATSEKFSSKGNPLSGEYTLTVSMSEPTFQTDNVRAVVGENGEYITGKYVVNEFDSNYVSAEFEFTI